MICARCLQEISGPDNQRLSHVHHDDLACDWAPPDPAEEWDHLEHLLVCEHLSVYHDTCCPWCQMQMAEL